MPALEQGDLAAAEARFRDGLDVAADHSVLKMSAVEGLAVVAARRGEPERALRLIAAAAALRRASGHSRAGGWASYVDSAAARARADLGPAASRRAEAAGGALTAEQTVRYVVEGDAEGPLTAREREVARLVAEGLSNRELAGRLGIAERTVEAHLDHIRAKLDLVSRTQVATWATRRLSRRAGPEPPR